MPFLSSKSNRDLISNKCPHLDQSSPSLEDRYVHKVYFIPMTLTASSGVSRRCQQKPFSTGTVPLPVKLSISAGAAAAEDWMLPLRERRWPRQ